MSKSKEQDQNISDLISEPGHFMAFSIESEGGDESDKTSEKDKNKRKLPLSIDKKRKEEAKRVYYSYVKSFNNAIDLISESEILFKNNFYSRALALALIAYEELGKSQIAADYYSGVLEKEDYEKAFVSHHKKNSFAGRYKAIGINKEDDSVAEDLGFSINKKASNKLEKIRQDCFYVDENNDPSEKFGKDEVEEVIHKVKDHIEYIQYAEWLNGRIGSKALFK